MTEIISNVPINIAAVNLGSPGKLMPLHVASLVAALSKNGLTSSVAWNTGALKPNDSLLEKEQATAAYGLEMGYQEDFDCNPAFKVWCKNAIEEALSKGTLEISSCRVIACRGCNSPLSLDASGVAPDVCGGCGNSETFVTDTMVLCMPISNWPEELQLAAAVYNQPSNWAGQLASLPEKMLISKPRLNGVSLEDFGLPGLHLDPRVTNAAFIAYQAIERNADHGWATLASEHLYKVAPFIYGFRHNYWPRIGYIGISKMPVNEVLADPQNVAEIGMTSVMQTLAALSLDGKTWVNNPVRVKEITGHIQRHRIEKLFLTSIDALSKSQSGPGFRASVIGLAKAIPLALKGTKP